MKLSNTKKLLIVAIVLILALGVGIYSLFSAIKSSNEETSKLSSELAFYEEKQQEILRNERGGDQPEAYIQRINSYFVAKDGVAAFIESIESEAESYGLDLVISGVQVVPYDSSREEDTKEYMVLRLETASSWQNLMYFVSYLEHLPYVVTVGRVNANVFQETNTDGEEEVVTGGWKGEIEMRVVKQK